MHAHTHRHTHTLTGTHTCTTFTHTTHAQDTNEPQYALSRLLKGDTGDLFVVGDPDQAVYR